MDARSSGTSGKGKGKDKGSWRSFARRDWLVFSRVDYLLTKVILGVAVLGVALFGLVRPILEASQAAPLAVSYTTPVSSGIELPRGASLDGPATMQLLLADATPGERLAQAVPGVLLAATTIAVCWLLFQLLRSTEAGEPFTRPNVRRINTIAIIVGAGGMLTQYAQGFANSAMNATDRLPRGADLTVEMTLNLLPLVVALVIALIGEAFRRGVRLRADVEGLV
jgi:hypothetical protein